MKVPFIDPSKLPPKAQQKLALSEAEVFDPDDNRPGDTSVSAEEFYRWPDGKFWKQRKRLPKNGAFIILNTAAKAVGYSGGVFKRHIDNKIASLEKELKAAGTPEAEITKMRARWVDMRKKRKKTVTRYSKVLLVQLYPGVNWDNI